MQLQNKWYATRIYERQSVLVYSSRDYVIGVKASNIIYTGYENPS